MVGWDGDKDGADKLEQLLSVRIPWILRRDVRDVLASVAHAVVGESRLAEERMVCYGTRATDLQLVLKSLLMKCPIAMRR